MAARRIAVLGSNSFSGSDFIDLLLDDPRNQVMGISRSAERGPLFLPYLARGHEAFTFRQGDLNSDLEQVVELLDDFTPSYIINFAAQSEVSPSWDNPDQWYETNVVALARLTSQLVRRTYLERYVHISSPEVYGNCDHDVTEDAPMHPTTPYAASKAAADLHLATLVGQYGFPCITVRSTNVYGAHQQLWKIIPRAVILIRKGQRVQLHGGGGAVKSYIHIRDVSHGEALAAFRGIPGELYHISPGRGYAVHEVVERICRLLDCPYADAVEMVAERRGQDAAYLVASAKIARDLGWRPTIDITTGLRKVVEWIESNWDEIETSQLEYVHKE